MDKTPNSAPSELPPATQCRCGHSKGDPTIKAQCQYSFWGWVTFLLGITTPPIQVEFRCEVCSDVVETLSDKDTLRHYQGW